MSSPVSIPFRQEPAGRSGLPDGGRRAARLRRRPSTPSGMKAPMSSLRAVSGNCFRLAKLKPPGCSAIATRWRRNLARAEARPRTRLSDRQHAVTRFTGLSTASIPSRHAAPTGRSCDGVASFGRRPTVTDDGAPLLETFVFDSPVISGEVCSVSFFGFARRSEVRRAER